METTILVQVPFGTHYNKHNTLPFCIFDRMPLFRKNQPMVVNVWYDPSTTACRIWGLVFHPYKPWEWKARDTATTVGNDATADDDVVASPSIIDKELFVFQQDGVRFLLSKKRCILADEVSPKRRG